MRTAKIGNFCVQSKYKGKLKALVLMISCHSCMSSVGCKFEITNSFKASLGTKLTPVVSWWTQFYLKVWQANEYREYCIWHSNVSFLYKLLLTCRFISIEVAAMIVRYQLPMLEVLLVLVLVLVLMVQKTSQTISGGFIPSLNVTANEWSGKNLKLRIQIFFETFWGEFSIWSDIVELSIASCTQKFHPGCFFDPMFSSMFNGRSKQIFIIYLVLQENIYLIFCPPSRYSMHLISCPFKQIFI